MMPLCEACRRESETTCGICLPSSGLERGETCGRCGRSNPMETETGYVPLHIIHSQASVPDGASIVAYDWTEDGLNVVYEPRPGLEEADG